MKKLIYLLVIGLSFILVSYQNNKEYTVSGTIEDEVYEGTNIYLQRLTDGGDMVTTDTAVVMNGKFFFSGIVNEPFLRIILFDENIKPQPIQNRIPFLIEPGNITVDVSSHSVSIKGTKVNDDFNANSEKMGQLGQQVSDVLKRYYAALDKGPGNEDEVETARAEYSDLVNVQMTNLNYEFLKDNMKNGLGEYLFITSFSKFEPSIQKELIEMANESFRETTLIKDIYERLVNIDNVAIGKKFIDFTSRDVNGNYVSLSDYAGNGNIVLIDFWAAWCGPCKIEMPNVVAAYDKYKSKGFEVVGVSFDREYEDWIKGIEDMGMTWPQMSDLLLWDSPIAMLYAIQGIPHTVLLDRDGVIIEKDLRGKELDDKLAELMP